MPIKTAIFIDFDNFHSNLDKLDPRAAERFADDPGGWLEWFRLGRHVMREQPSADASPRGSPAIPPDAEQRRILLRRCYLNPDKFRRYRTAFVRAGFTVHDCPPLTTRGKNAADLWMAIDILDAIAHPTGFEEFIILASDADFTPVLLRLREHDRRTTLVNDPLMAAALRAACDTVVPQGRFMAEALGLPPDTPTEAATEPPAQGGGAAARPRPGGMRGERMARTLAGQTPDLIELATRLHAAIGLPVILPTLYHAAFDAMAAAISETGEFDLVGRTVDRCRAGGMEIGLRPVGDIREILRSGGFDFGSRNITGAGVANAFHACVLSLCQQQEATLSAPERVLLDEWLGLQAHEAVA
jgi:hypothetical protein